MADQLQLRGGTTAQTATFTGALREVTVDTDKDTLVVHDNALAGGYPLMRENGSNSALALGSAATPSLKFTGDTNTGLFSPGADQVGIATGGTSRLVVDASGNVGIGTIIPDANLVVYGGGDAYARITDGTINTFLQARTTDSIGVVGTLSNHSLGLWINSSEKARITNSGKLLVGTSTSVLDGKFQSQFAGNTENGAIFNETANFASATFLGFALSGTPIGTVGRVGATSAVIYNTTSDYRLKTIVGSVTGQGERIDALKPIDFQWKEGGEQSRGFLAHEFQTIYANSVSGEKDAVDANGNPVYQAMQASTPEVIADLVAEIQQLRTRVTALEAA